MLSCQKFKETFQEIKNGHKNAGLKKQLDEFRLSGENSVLLEMEEEINRLAQLTHALKEEYKAKALPMCTSWYELAADHAPYDYDQQKFLAKIHFDASGRIIFNGNFDASRPKRMFFPNIVRKVTGGLRLFRFYYVDSLDYLEEVGGGFSLTCDSKFFSAKRLKTIGDWAYFVNTRSMGKMKFASLERIGARLDLQGDTTWGGNRNISQIKHIGEFKDTFPKLKYIGKNADGVSIALTLPALKRDQFRSQLEKTRMKGKLLFDGSIEIEVSEK